MQGKQRGISIVAAGSPVAFAVQDQQLLSVTDIRFVFRILFDTLHNHGFRLPSFASSGADFGVVKC